MKIIERTISDSVQIVENKEVGRNSYEVCATALATYDETCGRMEVVLDGFVRRFEMRGHDQILRPAWLPRSDRVGTHVSLDEAPEAAKEILASWAQKVRNSIPGSSEWRPEAAWLHGAEEKNLNFSDVQVS
jgi:hypothetical protein